MFSPKFADNKPLHSLIEQFEMEKCDYSIKSNRPHDMYFIRNAKVSEVKLESVEKCFSQVSKDSVNCDRNYQPWG